MPGEPDAHEVQEVPEVVHLVNQKELQDHQGKYKFAEIDDWSHLLNRS